MFLNIVWMQIGASLAGGADSIRNLTGTVGSEDVKCLPAGFTLSESEMAEVESCLGRSVATRGLQRAHRKSDIFHSPMKHETTNQNRFRS